MVLQAYIDDSGNTPQGETAHQDRFVLAGFAATAPKWEKFSDRWSEVLNKNPKIEYFKMNAVADGGKPFITESGMTIAHEFRLQKLNELAEVILGLEPLPIVVSLRWHEYERIVRGNVPAKLDSPYAVLFYQSMRYMHEFQIKVNKLLPERGFGFLPVDFIFDEQGAVGPQALQWHTRLAQVVPEPYKTMMGNTPVFRNDVAVVPLQAADMLAWHIRRAYAYPHERRVFLDRLAGISDGIEINELGERSLSQFVELSKRADREELDRGFSL
jgi:Protein of unknown function (DUF3800)